MFSALQGQTRTPAVISDIQFKGDMAFSASKLEGVSGLKENLRFNRQLLKTAAENLENFYHSEGYLFAQVDSIRTIYNRDSSAVQLHIHLHAGRQAYFGEIRVESDSLESDLYARVLTLRRDDRYSEARLKLDINRMLNIAADNGFPFASVNTERIKMNREGERVYVDVLIRIQEKEKAYIEKIVVRGNTYTKKHVILRELDIRPGSVYSGSAVEKIPAKLYRLGIFDAVRRPVLLSSEGDRVILLLRVEEGSSTTFDGVVGYVPEQEGRFRTGGYFTGLIDLAFTNLFGTGRAFEVHWKKPDRFSEEFQLSYNEPWILGYPVDVGIGLDRTVRDTTYIEWHFRFGTRMRIFSDVTLLANLKRKTVLPDSAASRELRLLQNRITDLEIGVEYDTRDYPLNPRSGLYYRSSYSYGFKENLGPPYIFKEDSVKKSEQLQRVDIQLSWFYNFWRNQVFAFQFNAVQIKGDRLQLTDYYWFGGSRSIRGYRENQFLGNVVTWTNLEYRFVLSRNSRIFLFNDWGFYQNNLPVYKNEDVLTGYGVGIRFETPLGVLGVDYGLSRGDSFGEGKIHFGIANRF